ncbi:MAG: glutamate mutase L [Oscillospiraceae bacterium]|nr:glutamate mutase L [Oscillospiraceae bacterium]
MKPVLLIDFGSTYTKLTAVDLDAPALLGTAAAYTTVETDINDGLTLGLQRLEEVTGKLDYAGRYACSSAAGGLRMMACGLVPELTGEAARMASLGAGAKVIGLYAYQLTDEDLEEIRAAAPDIFLLVGGTDGGNTANILHNARQLASIAPDFPIIVAGNRTAAAGCAKALAGYEVYVCENVMPKFGVVNIAPTQRKIREIFLQRIVQAKGLQAAAQQMDGEMMPTPAAVLRSLELLSQGWEEEPGIGELVAVDVGGATTDIYSMADGMPETMNTVYKGLPEPFAKRTVEGDIGMRYSIRGIVEEAGAKKLAQLSGLTVERVEQLVDEFSANPDTVPEPGSDGAALDKALASMAVRIGVRRHAGTMEETYTMMGKTFVQEGKNLTQIKNIVVTGGSLIHSEETDDIAGYALYSPEDPGSLRPREARVLVDRRYILAAMGLLSVTQPQAALQIMKKELK